jgi:hypothetical protein
MAHDNVPDRDDARGPLRLRLEDEVHAGAKIKVIGWVPAPTRTSAGRRRSKTRNRSSRPSTAPT